MGATYIGLYEKNVFGNDFGPREVPKLLKVKVVMSADATRICAKFRLLRAKQVKQALFNAICNLTTF